jgi:biopolymer transport protein ExbB
MNTLVLRVWTAVAVALSALPALADEAPPLDANAIRAALPRDLSPWNMFLTADSIVKVVIVGLVIASVVTWTVWFAKVIELTSLRRQLRRALDVLDEAGSLAEAAPKLNRTGPAEALAIAALRETSAVDGAPEGIKERTASRLERIEARATRAMPRGTGILATSGATAPFVGLFGTVWGIMNSFIGISKAQTTNLAVVAPGIAEALLATAIGLVAAIPAVIIYNHFARVTKTYLELVSRASGAAGRLLSRDLDRTHVSSGTHSRAAE